MTDVLGDHLSGNLLERVFTVAGFADLRDEPVKEYQVLAHVAVAEVEQARQRERRT